MGKLLLVVIVVAAVYLIVRAYARHVGRAQSTDRVATRTEDMVVCAHCGVHLPKSDGVLSDGSYFCSDEHRRLRAK